VKSEDKVDSPTLSRRQMLKAAAPAAAGVAAGGLASAEPAAMADTTILNETERSPIDGSESVRLATTGANSRATLANIVKDLGREKLTATRNYYVRKDGSDSNDGLTDSAGGAFLSVRRAVRAVTREIEFGQYDVNIYIGAGSYTEAIYLLGQTPSGGGAGWSGGINFYPAAGESRSTVHLETFMYMRDVVVKFESLDIHGAWIEKGTWCEFRGCEFSMGLINQTGHSFLQFNGETLISTGLSLTNFLFQDRGPCMCIWDGTVVVTGSPNFQNAFMLLAPHSRVDWMVTSVTGSATGPRFDGKTNASLYHDNLAEIPGSADGSMNGGWYVRAGNGTQLDIGDGFHQLAGRSSAPSIPPANTVRIWAEDNGAGKTRLMALFPTGVAQQIAIEP
jgi:hypothetical protein